MDIPDLEKRKKKKDKKGLDKEVDDLYEYHEDSDIPVTEKHTKEKKIKKMKK